MTGAGARAPRSVAVFGSADPREGDPLYEQARRLGWLLARQGWRVVNGGYGGVMEATSRGAREGGGLSIGVTTAAFARGPANTYLAEAIDEPDLYLRTRRLIEISDAYIILPGKSGTLAELSFLWALNRSGLLPPTRIVLLGDFWDRFLDSLKSYQMIEAQQLDITRTALTPEQAVEQLASFLR